jgi:hypothetical protein
MGLYAYSNSLSGGLEILVDLLSGGGEGDVEGAGDEDSFEESGVGGCVTEGAAGREEATGSETGSKLGVVSVVIGSTMGSGLGTGSMEGVKNSQVGLEQEAGGED